MNGKVNFRSISFLLVLSLVMGNFSGLGAQNKQLSSGPLFDGEPFLSVNPQNHREMVVAWMSWAAGRGISIKTRFSKDGGQTWSAGQLLPHQRSSFGSADPCMAWNNQGEVFLAYIDFNDSRDSGAVYLRKSTSGGLSWSPAVKVISIADDPANIPIDRPWMAIDQSGGIREGHIYITTMTAKGASAPFHPYLTRSTDGGNSFGPWRYLDTAGWEAGSRIALPMASPVVAANGKFYAAYPSFVPQQNVRPRYILASSSRGGVQLQHQVIDSPQKNLQDSLAKTGFLLRADPADSNHLAFFNLESPRGDGDVFLRESFDAGQSWTTPQRVNGDSLSNDRLQDLVWADFNAQGDLVAAWRDRRNAASSGYQVASEIWAAYRPADSSNFSREFSLSDTLAAYDAVLDGAGNDFMSLELLGDTIHAVWGDTRKGRLHIWYQRSLVNGRLISRRRLDGPANGNLSLYPQPVDDQAYLEGSKLERWRLLSGEGRLIRKGEWRRTSDSKAKILPTSDLASGTYLLQLKRRGEAGWRSLQFQKK